MVKVFITKYALSTSIFERSVEDCGDGMVKDLESSLPAFYHGEGREWHRTQEAAFARAEEMRVAKIKSLQKQISKLEKLRFA